MVIRWKRANDGFVESHDGEWEITPEYWSCVNPQAYTLWRRKPNSKHRQKVTFGVATQRDAKKYAEDLLAMEKR